MYIAKKMPKKTNANQARAENLHKWKAMVTKATVEEVEDDESVNSHPYTLNSHTHPSGPDTSSCQHDENDPELLDIIGALRGAVMVDDEDDISESESDNDGDEEIDEIHEITALEHFTSTLQKVHALAATAEREREKGRKRPKVYAGNSVRTKQWCRQRGRELAAKGFRSVKDWLLQMPPSASCESTACGSPRSDLREESEESSSEDEIQPTRSLQLKKSTVMMQMPEIANPEESEADSELESGTIVGSVTPVSKGVEDHETTEDREQLECQQVIAQMLKDLRDGKTPHDGTEETLTDRALNQLNYKNFPALCRALAKLTVKSKDKKIDVFLHARIMAMAGTLNLYLNPELSYSWRQASLVVSKSQGHGTYHAQNIRQWIHRFINYGKLPLHRYKGTHSRILEDEDIAMEIQLKLAMRAKNNFIKALDVVEIVASPEIQEHLAAAGIQQRKITERSGQQWLKKFWWRYSRKKNGMYIDGHEREDVVTYHQQFVSQFLTCYTPRMYTWDNAGVETKPVGFNLPGINGCFRIIPMTHDESTFHANDERKTRWIHESQKAAPERKGEGASIMISDFLTSEWGRLTSADGTECVILSFGLIRSSFSDVYRQRSSHCIQG